MALIICPECSGKVSDKAEACIHCGYPLTNIHVNTENKNYSVIFERLIHKKYRIPTQIRVEKYPLEKKDALFAYNLITKTPSTLAKGLTEENANYMMLDIVEAGGIVRIEESDEKESNIELNAIIDEYKKKKIIDGKLRCPKCNSDNVVIGTRGFSMITGFIGSNKTTNRCGKCGYTWQPR